MRPALAALLAIVALVSVADARPRFPFVAPCEPTTLCGDAIIAGSPAGLCDPSASLDLFNDFEDCVCGHLGACGLVCGDICVSGIAVGPWPASPDCEACYQDTATGCGLEKNACFDDE